MNIFMATMLAAIPLRLNSKIVPPVATIILDHATMTRLQERTIRQALEDFNSLAEMQGFGRLAVKRGGVGEPGSTIVRLTNRRKLRGEQKGVIGIACFSWDRSSIDLRPDMAGQRLYNTFLHELGHALTLPHSRDPEHIMLASVKAGPVLSDSKPPTRTERARWTTQLIAALLMKGLY